jgi:uncharacterized protein (TIGR03086 family)
VTDNQDVLVLRRGLDQLADLLAKVGPGDLARSTPCAEWSLGELVDHVVAAPEKFARMVRGESIDWSAPTPAAGDNPAGAFRAHGDELLAALGDGAGREGAPGADWQCAELAVHTWDLATALGESTDGLEPEVAERGLALRQDNLTAENRDPAFGPAQPAPDGANAYDRIAAFAGRSV